MGSHDMDLTIRADTVRQFHQDWQDGPSREERARQEFAELLLRNDAERLRMPALPDALACSAEVTPALHAVWHMRGDLRAEYDLTTVTGYFGLVVWMVRHGWKEFAGLRAQLPSAAPVLAAAWPDGDEASLTQFTCALWLSRGDLQAAFPITATEGRAAYAEWFLKKGAVEVEAWPVLSTVQAEWLHRLENPKPGDPLPVARFLLAIWTARPDLQAALPLAQDDWGARLWDWYFTAGIRELGVTPEWVLLGSAALSRAGIKVKWG